MKLSGKFYTSGLRFECTLCGNCCRLPGGSVEVSEEEIVKMALNLKMAVVDFCQRYCIPDSGSWKLQEQEDGACIFLKDRQCVIYGARPLQCRTFPFWPEYLKSSYRWKYVKEICPGVDRGKYYDPQEIGLLLKKQIMQKKNQ
jgi:Fe-S-cluster containining protein